MSKRKKPKVTLAQVGHGGCKEIQFTTVDDPFEPGKKLTVAKNVRGTPLDYEHSRGTITDDQKEAGRRFEALHDRAEIGGAKAFDYSQQKVDTSYIHKGLAEGVMEATQELSAIRLVLGHRNYDLLVKIVGRGIHVDALAREGSCGDDWAIRQSKAYYKKSLSDTLQDLADHLGVAARGPRYCRMRSEVAA